MKYLMRHLLRLILELLYRLRVVGEVRIPDGERVMVVGNHQSFLDGIILGVLLPGNPLFVIHTEIVRKWYFRWGLSLVDYLPIDATNPMAMRRVIRVLETGRPVVIFPEGRITVTGSLMKIYDGPAFIASRTEATVVPFWLDGASRTPFSRTSGKYPRSWFPRITVTAFPPRTLPRYTEGSARERRRKAGEDMRHLMQHMAFAARPPRTLYQRFVDSVQLYGAKRKMVEDIKLSPYSYGDLLRMTLALTRLVERESGEGENIGILLPNLAPTLGLILGLSARGRVPALLNFTAGADGVRNACVAAKIRTVITSRAFVENPRVATVLAGFDQQRVLYLEDIRQNMRLPDMLWLIGWGIHFPRSFARTNDPEDPAVVLFTSGSEGRPKGVVLSHRALLANVDQIAAVVDLGCDDKFLNALPMFHSFGLTGGTLLPLLNGAEIMLYPTPLHYRIIPEVAYDRQCTVLLGTGTFLNNYARFAHPYDFFRMRYVIAGAEKLADSVRNIWFEKYGIRIFEGYGATETAPVIAVNTALAFRNGTVGEILPNIEAKIETVPGIEGGGLLHVRGPNVMSGYLRYEKPGVIETPSSSFGDGWYNTGDVVELDAEGFLHIKGRVKRFAKVAGEMISLEVVETLAGLASDRGTHAVSTQPDPRRGENIILFTTDAGLERSQLTEAAQKNGYPELAVPRKIVVVKALPLLGTGKTDYVTLQKMALDA